MSEFAETIETISEETMKQEDKKQYSKEEVDEHDEDSEDEDSEDEDSDEEEEWSEITIKGVVYYINPEQTRWIRSDDMCPLLREYFPGMENDFDYEDLEPIRDE
jgi:TATA-binding protein-associated factor Taf7